MIGKDQGFSFSMGSGGWSVQGMLVKSGFTTTLFPAKSLPNSKWTPLKGKEGRIPTATKPVTKSEDK